MPPLLYPAGARCLRLSVAGFAMPRLICCQKYSLRSSKSFCFFSRSFHDCESLLCRAFSTIALIFIGVSLITVKNGFFQIIKLADWRFVFLDDNLGRRNEDGPILKNFGDYFARALAAPTFCNPYFLPR